LQRQFICWYDTPTVQAAGSLVWCHAVVSLQITIHSSSLLCLHRQVTKLASALFDCWPLLRINNKATISQSLTSTYGSRSFAACDCWTQAIHLGR